MNATTLLIVEDDPDLLAHLSRHPSVSDYRVVGVPAFASALEAIERDAFDVALLDLGAGADTGFEAMRAIKARAPETEIVVMSGTSSLAAAVASYELKAFAFVAKPFDVDHLLSTVRRAVAHREVLRANDRLAWEQTLLNEIGEELRNLMAPEQLVERVLRRLVKGMRVELSAARLLNPQTRAYDISIVSAPPDIHLAWTTPNPIASRPGDRVLATRLPLRIPDLHEGLDAASRRLIPLRSSVSVPMLVGEDLIGVLSVASLEADRFTADDQRLLGTVANHVAVSVQNARLHAYVRAGKQEWEATFDAIGDPIAVYDRRGRVLRGNAGLASLLQRPLTSLRGLSCDEIGLCSAPFPKCAVGLAGSHACAQEEITRGDQIFSVTTCPVLDVSDGAGTVQIAKNVTPEIQNARRMRQMSDELAATNARLVATVDRLKATQAQLLQAEKLSAIGQLVAGVAHELNNPLTSVIGYAQLLQEELSDVPPGDPIRASAQLSHDLRRIAEESERAARIVRNLLAFARRQTAARAEQDVADIVGRVLSLRSYEFRLNAIELQTNFEAGLPPVLGDGGQLQQALLNLLLNAEQAMRSRPVRRIDVGARRVPKAAGIEIFITDTGHGIPDENVRRIFDPFFTTREVGEGTGLGLSICYGIVRDHGGAIAVESRVGQGTTFRLLLPARTVSSVDALRVLVAHHDPTERDYVAAALTGWGHTVTCAESADDARARLAAGPFDAAFVDTSLMTDRGAWGGRTPSGDPVPIIEMSESAEYGGVAPPFELAALRAALRGLTKEYV